MVEGDFHPIVNRDGSTTRLLEPSNVCVILKRGKEQPWSNQEKPIVVFILLWSRREHWLGVYNVWSDRNSQIRPNYHLRKRRTLFQFFNRKPMRELVQKTNIMMPELLGHEPDWLTFKNTIDAVARTITNSVLPPNNRRKWTQNTKNSILGTQIKK